MSVKIRNLTTFDLFEVSKILNKMDLDVDIRNNGENFKELALNLIVNLCKSAFENLHLAEKEVKKFFASLVEMEVKEFEKQDPVVFFEIIEQLSEYKSIREFFKKFFLKAKQ